MEKVKFYLKDDETFECGFKRPTMHIKDELLEINIAMLGEQKKLDEEFPSMYEIKKLSSAAQVKTDIDALAKMVDVMSDAQMSMDFAKYSGQLQKIIDIHNVLKIQLGIQSDHLSEDQQKLVMSDANSDFWQIQDLTEIEKALTFFRETYKIG